MILFTIECKNQEEENKIREEFHNALAGTKAYIDSDIAICEDDNDHTKFYLVVGRESADRNNDRSYNIKAENLLDTTKQWEEYREE